MEESDMGLDFVGGKIKWIRVRYQQSRKCSPMVHSRIYYPLVELHPRKAVLSSQSH